MIERRAEEEGTRMKLARQIRDLGRLAAKLGEGVLRLRRKPARALNADPEAARKAYLDAFEHKFFTGRALWGADAEGQFHLLEPKDLPTETAVRELFEYLVPPLFCAEGREEQTIWIGKLAALYGLGIPLTVKYLYGANKAEHGQCCPHCPRRSEAEGRNPEAGDGDEARQGSRSVHGAVQDSADRFPKTGSGHLVASSLV